MHVDDVGHGFEKHTLAGQWMQALDVEQQVAMADAQGSALRGLRLFIVPRKAFTNRRIHDPRVATSKAKFVRAAHQSIAVERDVGGAVIGAREEIGPAASGAVMPDLGAIQRENGRLACSPREQDRHLREEPVAVHMHEICAGDSRSELALHAHRGEH